MDALFILALLGLYGVSHWLIRAISRLGGPT